jgi:CHAT domain-containing protein
MAGPGGLVVFVVTAERVRPVTLGSAPQALGRRVENYVQLLTSGDEGAARNVAARLAREILDPLLANLPAATDHLIIVPDGAVHLVPFETLRLPGDDPAAPDLGRLVLDRYAVSYVPSAGTMVRLDEPRSGDVDARRDLLMLAASVLPESLRENGEAGGSSRGSLAVYADEGLRIPELPYSAREAERVRRIVSARSEIDLGADASEARLKRLLPDQFRIVHVAAHGLVSAVRPDRSALVLAAGGAGGPGATEDGLLHAFEIRRLRVDCDLVVLSACQTTRGRILGGEGEQGLARAFVAAGARSVLASLWSVEDAATASLMESFYAGLASGLPPAQALRRAKLEVRGRSATHGARDWAAFVLIGHGDRAISLEGRPWWDPGGRSAHTALAVAGPGALLGGGLILGAALRRRSRAD